LLRLFEQSYGYNLRQGLLRL